MSPDVTKAEGRVGAHTEADGAPVLDVLKVRDGLREFRADGDEPGRLRWRSQCPGAAAAEGGTALPA